MIAALLLLWVLWIAANLLLMATARMDAPFFNGFRVHIPERYRDLLSEEEYLAVYYHECGHRHHFHVWKNFARVCFFDRADHETRWRQELEADDYACGLGCGPALSSALRKLSNGHADVVRASRIDELYQKGPQAADSPTAREARSLARQQEKNT